MNDVKYRLGEDETTEFSFNPVTVKGITKEQWKERECSHIWQGHPGRDKALDAVYSRCNKALGVEDAPAAIVPTTPEEPKEKKK